jgi:oligopeptidase B
MQEPKAKIINHKLETHGDTRIDNYYWLNDRENLEVIQYLKDENAYQEAGMAHTKALQDTLYKEITEKLNPTDMSVPYFYKGYYYYSRYEEGKDYPFHCRKLGSQDAAEEIMLDVPKMAKGHAYYAIGGRSISTDKNILAFGVDTVSRRIYTIYFKNLTKGALLKDKIPNTTGSIVWANDNETVFYTVKDDSLRSYKIFKHKIGTPISKDKLVFHEKDETFNTYIYKTKSEAFIIIGSAATLSNEFRYCNANTPDEKFTLFQKRKHKLEYGFDHYGDHFYMLTNYKAKNFRLMRSGLTPTKTSQWEAVIAHNSRVLIEDVEFFKDFIVLTERVKGNSQLKIRNWDGAMQYIPFKEKAFTAYLGVNPEFDTTTLRLHYTSMTTPSTVYDYSIGNQHFELLKQEQVLDKKFKINDYKSERIMTTADDGTKVPISIVYRKDKYTADGKNPLLLYGYGSYGHSMDPYFSISRLSLLDRGFVFAIAHIRGGQEMGRQWYEDGKFLKKINTFTDFIACGKHLIDKKYTSLGNLYGMGGSAGGLLMGAVMNMAPALWKGLVAQVPFVDVVTTMLDESIPLTTGEFDEWGNPKDKTYYDYMKSYSPYDNVKAVDYPAMLVTTGLHDSQVQYWEPAKWVAKLRVMRKDKNPLYLHTNMETGHGGASGRYEAYKEIALNYSFLLDLAGKG